MLDEPGNQEIPIGPDPENEADSTEPFVQERQRSQGTADEEQQHAEAQIAAFLEDFSKMPSEQRLAIVSQVPKDQQMVFFQYLTQDEREQFIKAQKALGQRQVGNATTEKEMSFDERQTLMAPDMDEATKATYKNIFDQIQEKVTLDAAEKQSIISTFQASHTKQKEAEMLLAGTSLNKETKDDIIRQLEVENPDAEELPPGELARLHAQGDAMGDKLGQFEGHIDQQLVELAGQDLPPEEKVEERAKLLAKKGKIASLSQSITDLFAQDSTKRVARITWKITYYALLTAFVLLIMEMNLIGKIPQGSNRR